MTEPALNDEYELDDVTLAFAESVAKKMTDGELRTNLSLADIRLLGRAIVRLKRPPTATPETMLCSHCGASSATGYHGIVDTEWTPHCFSKLAVSDGPLPKEVQDSLAWLREPNLHKYPASAAGNADRIERALTRRPTIALHRHPLGASHADVVLLRAVAQRNRAEVIQSATTPLQPGLTDEGRERANLFWGTLERILTEQADALDSLAERISNLLPPESPNGE